MSPYPGNPHSPAPLRPRGVKPSRNLFASLSGSLARQLSPSPMRVVIVSRGCIEQWEANALYPAWVSALVATGASRPHALSTSSRQGTPFTKVIRDNGDDDVPWAQYFLSKRPLVLMSCI